jgi:hypothetical protein
LASTNRWYRARFVHRDLRAFYTKAVSQRGQFGTLNASGSTDRRVKPPLVAYTPITRLMGSLFTSGQHLADDIAEAPNPKPTVADKARFGKLASLYTAFSSEFAAHAIDICLRNGCTRIADPFSGMGTLAEAARTQPVDLFLSDISPFAALSGAFRAASRLEIEQAASLLEAAVRRIRATKERDFFSRLFDKLTRDSKNGLIRIVSSPSSPENRVLALSIYLAALSRIRLHRRFAGSNPTWVRRPDTSARRPATVEAIQSTLTTVREFARHLPNAHPANNTCSSWSAISELRIPHESLDAVVTSPPYANRTDYIRHYQPASELLIEALGLDERLIRVQQIGTPLIRAGKPTEDLPLGVHGVLEMIRTHGSYASERYYYKGFLYYFGDMYDALTRMHGWLRDGGLLLMVVQDAYYKDLHIPTSELLAEMAESIGFGRSGHREWRVRNYLSQLSPHSRRSVRDRELCESVLAFSK